MAHRPSSGSLVLAVLWTAVVVVLLSLPGDEIPDAGVDWFDKPVHALLFAVHYALLAPVLARRVPRRPGGWAALASGGFATVMETAQLWIPGRGWEWLDLVAGFAGIAAVAAWLAFHRARLSALS